MNGTTVTRPMGALGQFFILSVESVFAAARLPARHWRRSPRLGPVVTAMAVDGCRLDKKSAPTWARAPSARKSTR